MRQPIILPANSETGPLIYEKACGKKFIQFIKTLSEKKEAVHSRQDD